MTVYPIVFLKAELKMEVDIVRIESGKRRISNDIITDESFLTIYLNDIELLTLACTKENVRELSVGFLFSAGLIHSLDDIARVFVSTNNTITSIELKDREFNTDILFKRIYTSGCGKGVLFPSVLDLAHQTVIQSELTVQSERIIELMRAFERKSESFKKTGGVHSAALSDGSKILVFSEDIGRHNCIDKIIGIALYTNVNMNNSLVLTSGRISSEIIFKLQKMKSPVLVSRSAPTGLAVELAKKWNVTLVGFARGKRMNVYTAPERIV